MLLLGKNYAQMTSDFEKKAVICALLLLFEKSEEGRCTFNLESASVINCKMYKDLCACTLKIFFTSVINFSVS